MGYYHIWYKDGKPGMKIKCLVKLKEACLNSLDLGKYYVLKPDYIIYNDSDDKEYVKDNIMSTHHFYNSFSSQDMYDEIRYGESLGMAYSALNNLNNSFILTFFAYTEGQAKYVYKRHIQRLASIDKLADISIFAASLDFPLDDDEDGEVSLYMSYSEINHDITWQGKDGDDGADPYYDKLLSEALKNNPPIEMTDEEISEALKERLSPIANFKISEPSDYHFNVSEEVEIVDGDYKGKIATIKMVDYENELLVLKIKSNGETISIKIGFDYVKKVSHVNDFEDVAYINKQEDIENNVTVLDIVLDESMDQEKSVSNHSDTSAIKNIDNNNVVTPKYNLYQDQANDDKTFSVANDEKKGIYILLIFPLSLVFLFMFLPGASITVLGAKSSESLYSMLEYSGKLVATFLLVCIDLILGIIVYLEKFKKIVFDYADVALFTYLITTFLAGCFYFGACSGDYSDFELGSGAVLCGLICFFSSIIALVALIKKFSNK